VESEKRFDLHGSPSFAKALSTLKFIVNLSSIKYKIPLIPGW